MVGAGYGAPVRFSGTVGLFAPIAHRHGDPPALGLAGEALVGRGGYGLRLGVDLLPWVDHKFVAGAYGHVVRTWGNPLGVGLRQTLLGGEIEVSFVKLVWTSVGILTPIDGSVLERGPALPA